MKPSNKVIPNHNYKVTFGVKQTEKIEEKCNEENITPTDFIKKATLSAADVINGANMVAGK